MTGRACDILDLLPDGAVVFADNPTFLSFSVPHNGELTSDCLDGLYDQLFTTKVDIDFGTYMVAVHFNTEPFALLESGSPIATVELKADTESERLAAAFARSLGCIDYDNLQPRFTINTEAGVTSLLITRLHRVSHCALAAQLPPECTRVVYRFASKDIAVHYAARKKRKAV
jgi:hypothetical protein